MILGLLKKLKNIVNTEVKLKEKSLDKRLIKDAKRFGFSDKQIARATEKEPLEVRKIRKDFGISSCCKAN